MRTKDEIADILSKRLVSQKLQDSTWNDLVNALQGLAAPQKDWIVKHIANRKNKLLGERLYVVLLRDAEERAKAEVDAMLADDTLSLAELDSLIG